MARSDSPNRRLLELFPEVIGTDCVDLPRDRNGIGATGWSGPGHSMRVTMPGT